MSDIISDLRKFKIFKLAAVDLVGSIFFFYVISKSFKSDRPILFGLLSIPASIFIHKAFNVETQLTKEWDNLLNGKPDTAPEENTVSPAKKISRCPF